MRQILRFAFVFVWLFNFSNAFGQSAALSRFVDAEAKKLNFSGTILVARNSRNLYARSFGFANRQHRVPNRIETRYKIASVTKAFTAVLILQLFERGKLDLHKTLRTYLPEYAGAAGDRVTVHQLLNHTAGMANLDRHLTSVESALKNGMPHYQTQLTTDELLAKYCSENLVSEPGQAFDYNNADYIILGKIVERLHGKPFEKALAENILKPLEMRDSGMLYQHRIVERLADTYFYRDDLRQTVNDLPVYPENWYAAGAMYATARDLLKFSDALFRFKLLKPATLALMLAPGLDEYGYGVWVYDAKIEGRRRRVVKRPGRIMGAQSMLFHLVDEKTSVIMLSNTDAVDLDDFAAKISRRAVK